VPQERHEGLDFDLKQKESSMRLEISFGTACKLTHGKNFNGFYPTSQTSFIGRKLQCQVEKTSYEIPLTKEAL
jgi:hypothetical protein